MPERIELPSVPAGDEKAQLQQMYRYLYQMAETLNNNLAQIGGNELTDDEMAVMREVIGTPAEAKAGDGSAFRKSAQEAETLKSLIIKTAEFVRTSLDEYTIRLFGSTEAEGRLGRYVRKTKLDVDINPDGIRQNFTFAEIIRGLRTYEINAKNYIYTGLLRTVDDVPVYGVAIGKDIVTFTQDGEEIYTDSNKVAELTADELTFYISQAAVARYSGSAVDLYCGTHRIGITANRLSFYSGTLNDTWVEVMYLTGGKVYAAKDLEISSGANLNIESGAELNLKSGGGLDIESGADLNIESGGALNVKGGGKLYVESTGGMEIKSGGNMKISSGGVLDVNTNNFVLSSANKKMQTGNWTFDQYGVHANLNNNNFGMYANSGQLILALSESSPGVASGLALMRLWEKKPTHAEQGITGEPNLDFGQGNFYGAIGSSAYPLVEMWAKYMCYWYTDQQSSRAVKDRIEDLPEMGDVIDALNPVSYEYKAMPGEKRYGLIWEDTYPVLPEICHGRPEYDPDRKGIDYMDLIGILLKEIQSLRRRVAALEHREEEE